LLATAATIIASQAVITGSYSVARQAMQLGFLPRLRIRHTSEVEGQIYVPVINWSLGIGVVVLVVAFQSSTRLADIYGVAVTATFVLNTVLFLAVARGLWHWAKWKLITVGTVFLTVEVAFFSSNMAKITHGAYLSLAVGLAISLLMMTWRRGRVIVTRNRTAQEGSLQEFLVELGRLKPPIVRVPGTGVFLSPGKETTPLALRAEVEHNHVLQEKVLIVSLDTVGVPRVNPPERFTAQALGSGRCKVTHLTVRVGYHDSLNVPYQLTLARKHGFLERNLDIENASYFLSRITIAPGGDTSMPAWRKNLFMAMARNAASPIEHFGLPQARTVEMGSQVTL
jgi:KUP system potassium uptake protein